MLGCGIYVYIPQKTRRVDGTEARAGLAKVRWARMFAASAQRCAALYTLNTL